MIAVERYCYCGVKLVAKAKDETEARAKLEEFLRNHIGREDDGTVHRMIRRGVYWQMARRARAEMAQSAEAAARKILEEGRLAPKSRKYRIKRRGEP